MFSTLRVSNLESHDNLVLVTSVAAKFQVQSIQYFDNDRKILVAGSYPNRGGRLFIQSADKDGIVDLGQHNRTVGAAALSPNEKLIISSGDYWADKPELFAWKFDGQWHHEPLSGHSTAVMTITFSQDGSRFVTAGGPAGHPNKAGSALIWDADRMEVTHDLVGHEGMVFSAAYSPCGTFLATGAADRTVRIWNPVDGSLLREFGDLDKRVTSLEFAPDGSSLAAGTGRWGTRGSLYIIDTETWQVSKKLERDSWINDIAWLPGDNAILVVGGPKGLVQICDTTDGNWEPPIMTAKPYTNEAVSLSVSANGRIAAVGTEGHDVSIIELSRAQDGD